METRDIDNCKTFEEVRQMRLDLDELIRCNKFKLDDILTKIYKNSTRFIFELLQNADDAKAKKARFVLFDDKIEFYHNGTKDFDLKSIIGITGIGDSEKKDDEKTIGKFGVGFKSVFRITKAPHIYNRLCSFKIERICVPEKIQPKVLPDGYTTEFELPFDSDRGLKKTEAFKEIKKELSLLDELSVMFMNNLKVVEIRGKVRADIILEEKKTRGGFSEITDISNGSKCLVFRGGTENRVAIAYQLDSNDNIAPCENTDISVYFPTHIRSGLAFRVNAPFETPVTREDIDFNSAINKKVLKEVGDVFSESILKLRDAGYYDCNFVEEVLPINQYWNSGELYEYLYERLISLFKKNALIPVGEKIYRKSNSTLLADDYEMTTLWQYDGKPWADVPHYYRDFRYFLCESVGVKCIDLKQFAKDISKSIKNSEKNNTAWLYDFYSFCGSHNDCYELKEVPIIKNRADGFVAAWKNDSQNIFKPPAKGVASTRILNKILSDDALDRLANDDNRKANYIKTLLTQLEIKERSPKSTIEMDIMSKWQKETSLAKRRELFMEIVKIYNSANKDEKNAIANYLRDKKIVYGGCGKERDWYKGSDLYSRDEYLTKILNRYHVNFIDSSFWTEKYTGTTDKNGNIVRKNEGTSELCEAIGVSRSFRTVECKKTWNYIYYSDIKNRYKADIYENECGFGFKSDRTVDDISEIIKNVKNDNDSYNIAHAISKIPEEELVAKIGASSERSYIHSSSPIIKIPALFVRILNDEKWIIKDGKKISPHELIKKDFVDMLGLGGDEPFLNWILFEPDGMQNMTEKQRGLAELADFISDERYQKLRDECLNKKEKEEAAVQKDERPDIDVSSFQEASLVEYAPEVDEAYNDAGAASAFQIEVRDRKEKTVKTGEKAETTTNYKKQIGDNGEKGTLNKLLSEYPSAKGYTVQSYCGNHKAYDFKVTKGDETIKFIDSKYTEDGTVEMSPSQVDASAEYGDKYELYVYVGKRKEFLRIVNPYARFVNRDVKSGIVFQLTQISGKNE